MRCRSVPTHKKTVQIYSCQAAHRILPSDLPSAFPRFVSIITIVNIVQNVFKSDVCVPRLPHHADIGGNYFIDRLNLLLADRIAEKIIINSVFILGYKAFSILCYPVFQYIGKYIGGFDLVEKLKFSFQIVK